MNIALPLPRIENALHHDLTQDNASLLAGLLQPRARIDSKYFYDDTGCQLFNRICQLAEYYPTRTEAGIFRRYAQEIAEALPAGSQWVDLGCGDCAKSLQWLRHVAPERLVGVDIAGDFLRSSLVDVAAHNPDVECIGVVSDFTRALDLSNLLGECPDAPPVFFYPGSSIGNFTRHEALRLLRSIRRDCGTHGRLLIGIDLVKPVEILEAAYDDRAGVTAEFNLHVLDVVNQKIGSNFERSHFRHRARYDCAHNRIEMQLVAQRDHCVQLDNQVQRCFRAGEHVLTEYSHKYTPNGFRDMLAEAGFAQCQFWTDPYHWFGVFLAEPGQ